MIILANTKNLLFEYTVQCTSYIRDVFKEKNVINTDLDILYSTDSSQGKPYLRKPWSC